MLLSKGKIFDICRYSAFSVSMKHVMCVTSSQDSSFLVVQVVFTLRHCHTQRIVENYLASTEKENCFIAFSPLFAFSSTLFPEVTWRVVKNKKKEGEKTHKGKTFVDKRNSREFVLSRKYQISNCRPDCSNR